MATGNEELALAGKPASEKLEHAVLGLICPL
jgi:hypothetical protein